MRRTTWIILLLLTIASVVAAAFVLDRKADRLAAREYGQPLFPQLAGQINAVARLEFVTPKGAWSLSRDADGKWHHDARNGYPADADEVKRLVVALSRATVIAPKTSDPELHDRLGLEEPQPVTEGAADSKVAAIKVIVRDEGGALLAGVILGKTKQLGDATEPAKIYVRRAGENATWLAEGFFNLKPAPTDWLDRDLFKITKDVVTDIRIAHPDKPLLELNRSEYGYFHVTDLPEGLQEQEIRLTATGRALEFLKPRDVAPESEVDFAGATQTTFTTQSGWIVTVDVRDAGRKVDNTDAFWLRFDVQFDAGLIEQLPTGIDGKEPEPIVAEDEEARARAAAALVRGWAYLFPSFTAENFTQTLENLTKPKPEEDS
ncbi:MAG: DUF4340 domain-containing protein [Minwuia sp.]|nr:DUF4340 domain-containing protein [Minwuia sp.]